MGASGFSKIEFLLILISVVYGYCVVDLFENWGRMLRRNNFYWETSIWSVIIFLSIAFLWHNAWDNIPKIAERTSNYIMSLLPSIFFFILTSLLFPDRMKEEALRTTFLKNRKRFFLAFALVIAMILGISNISGDPQPALNYVRIFFFFSAILLAIVDQKIIRSLVALFAFSWFGYLLFSADF